ncbi:thiamine biosynthesis lipoprotein [Alcanivorax hongdengensis A-11-3]|uniref:FAD:protein FMN transferase n=1 Tax=Alcanivorax hongdengensis A-11-3 TaxID=1177179 RepID=L0W848_9GAMM|nr:FAD:protein FMN transferase [Alcanivorax hongdengensis]EKF72873.1 thiamine biosynthesis lipoprotein [Alcanivorax hongdengensis A-11-3]
MDVTLEHACDKESGPLWRGRFSAMASPCEVLVRVDSRTRAAQVLDTVAAEAARIEQHFSRYRDDNPVWHINNANGDWVDVDEEIERLLEFADYCYVISDGAFDITSGVLRRAWRFDGSDRLPGDDQVQALLPLIGWQKVERQPGRIRMPAGMELDFGGIGKEYAVDRAFELAAACCEADLLVNFGGDLRARSRQEPWRVGMEGTARPLAGTLALTTGALATSGDSRRFLLKDGIRYSHVLDPRTGYPVSGAPRAVTVLATQCTQAGLLATLALLQGEGAQALLTDNQVTHWIQREGE